MITIVFVQTLPAKGRAMNDQEPGYRNPSFTCKYGLTETQTLFPKGDTNNNYQRLQCCKLSSREPLNRAPRRSSMTEHYEGSTRQSTTKEHTKQHHEGAIQQSITKEHHKKSQKPDRLRTKINRNEPLGFGRAQSPQARGGLK